jgi:hypothetical protein
LQESSSRDHAGQQCHPLLQCISKICHRSFFTVASLYSAGTRFKGAAVPVACRKTAAEIMLGNNATCPVLPLLTAPSQQRQDEQGRGTIILRPDPNFLSFFRFTVLTQSRMCFQQIVHWQGVLRSWHCCVHGN